MTRFVKIISIQKYFTDGSIFNHFSETPANCSVNHNEILANLVRVYIFLIPAKLTNVSTTSHNHVANNWHIRTNAYEHTSANQFESNIFLRKEKNHSLSDAPVILRIWNKSHSFVASNVYEEDVNFNVKKKSQNFTN